jgi:hypothetical protein
VALTVPLQEVSGSALKRMWSRRRSSIKEGPEQLTLSHYLTNEVLPNLDNYRLSLKGAGIFTDFQAFLEKSLTNN